MAPFLVETLEQLLRQFYAKFIRRDILDEAKTTMKLLKIDLTARENRVSNSKIDVGFSLKYDLQQLRSKEKITKMQEEKFKGDCGDFLIAMCEHMIEKSPLTSLLARCLRCFSPLYMTECPDICELFMEKLLYKLVSYKKISSSLADSAKNQYSKFLKEVVLHVDNKPMFEAFKKEKDRLDTFLCKFMDTPQYRDLWSVVKICLILSHGQAQVERGFNDNKSLNHDNVSGELLVALRTVCDHMKFYKLKPHEVEMTSSLLQSCRQANKRYRDNEKSSRIAKYNQEQLKAKETLMNDITSLNTEIQQSISSIEKFKKDADTLLQEAETKTTLG